MVAGGGKKGRESEKAEKILWEEIEMDFNLRPMALGRWSIRQKPLESRPSARL